MPRTRIPLTGGRAGTSLVAEHNLYDLRMRFPTTGNIWFVDSGVSASGNGLSPDTAVTTIDAAINLATASNGDIIIVMEGHAETIAAAAGIALDVIGLTIVGLGRGRSRPVITFGTAAGASLDISAASNWIENVVLLNGVASQTAVVNVTAADVMIKGCEFQLGDATTQALLGILTTDAADRLIVEDNWFHTSDAVTAAIRIVGTDDIIVRRNLVTGKYATTGAIEQVTTAGNRHLYEGNTVLNTTADGNNKSIVLKSDTTGFVSNNRLAVIDSTCPSPTTGAGAMWGGNYQIGAVDTAGVLK